MNEIKKVIFVCTGNICRSQMAHMMLLDKNIKNIIVDSAGISAEESGNLIDPRAKNVLKKHGINVIKHYAKKITNEDIYSSDLVLAMTYSHFEFLKSISNAKNIFMFNQFVIKNSKPSNQIDIVDPWYGPDQAFEKTYNELSQGLPNIIDYLLAL